jgi:hypothetical protein
VHGGYCWLPKTNPKKSKMPEQSSDFWNLWVWARRVVLFQGAWRILLVAKDKPKKTQRENTPEQSSDFRNLWVWARGVFFVSRCMEDTVGCPNQPKTETISIVQLQM